VTVAVRNRRGLSIIELIVTVVILSVLGMLVLPLAQMTAKRTKELELRRNLREIRTAIDKYKDTYDEAVKQKKKTNISLDESGYPKTLEVLVEGEVDPSDPKGEKKIKYLRRIPPDPFNHTKSKDAKDMWGLRSYKDKPDSDQWGGEDVFDVYSLSNETAIDGTKYKDW
jgi:general secretion pathway protein G